MKRNKKVCGVGINDLGTTLNVKAYKVWQHMLERCYSEERQKIQPSYVGASVCDEWLLYSNFYRWYISQPNQDGWQLDKDLILPGNRLYSPETCKLIPSWLNSFVSDRKRGRGQCLIGVRRRKDTGKYEARCNNCFTNKSQYLGVYFTEIEAHGARREYKLSLLNKMKKVIDQIDLRLYHSIYKIIENQI